MAEKLQRPKTYYRILRKKYRAEFSYQNQKAKWLMRPFFQPLKNKTQITFALKKLAKFPNKNGRKGDSAVYLSECIASKGPHAPLFQPKEFSEIIKFSLLKIQPYDFRPFVKFMGFIEPIKSIIWDIRVLDLFFDEFVLLFSVKF